MTKKKESEERYCFYCEHAGKTVSEGEDGERVMCNIRGIVMSDYSCRKFKYDLLKREHKRMPDIPKGIYVDINDTK